MSVGNFTDSKYEAADGKIYPIRIQPETAQAVIASDTNNAPAGAVTGGLPTLRISSGRRGFGVHPRYIIVELTANGTGANAGYTSGRKLKVVSLTPAFSNGLVKGSTGTYLGIACKVITIVPELIK
jgi:hypothetical protein